MTEERRQKLLQSSQGPGAEPFSQYNHMKVTAVDDGTATVGQLAVYYNPERTRQWASLPAGTWRKVSDGVHAGVTPFGPCFRDALELAPTSVTVLVAE